jgi:ABC-type transport system involved in cytochrome bd biosynthesis fused ATPase/permease subunit
MPLLKIFDLRKSYPTPQEPLVLKGVNLTLETGANLALMGESGSGTSTLLQLIAGSMTPIAVRSDSVQSLASINSATPASYH